MYVSHKKSKRLQTASFPFTPPHPHPPMADQNCRMTDDPYSTGGGAGLGPRTYPLGLILVSLEPPFLLFPQVRGGTWRALGKYHLSGPHIKGGYHKRQKRGRLARGFSSEGVVNASGRTFYSHWPKFRVENNVGTHFLSPGVVGPTQNFDGGVFLIVFNTFLFYLGKFGGVFFRPRRLAHKTTPP
jgi:hypothetical protein